MKWKRLTGKYGCCIAATFLSIGLLHAQEAAFTLQFLHTVGRVPLVKDSLYVNDFGESFTVRSFKYYISHIRALDASGDTLKELSGVVYLVDMADAASGTIVLPALPEGATDLAFMIGVDSSINTGGVLTGSLDPARGMFWTWNSGYIMAKLEGKSAASKAPGNYFTYHVGGYKVGQQTARWVSLPLGDVKGPGGSSGGAEGVALQRSAGASGGLALPGASGGFGNGVVPSDVMFIVADVLKWFKSKHAVSIASQPVCHAPGSLAVLLADNYATMFSVLNEP